MRHERNKMAKFLPLNAIFFPKLIDICTLIYLSLYAILWEEKYKLGPDRLELIIFDIIDKKFYNHPSRLQL